MTVCRSRRTEFVTRLTLGLCGYGRRSGGPAKTDCDNATEVGRPRPNCCLSQVIRVASPTVTDIVISLTASQLQYGQLWQVILTVRNVGETGSDSLSHRGSKTNDAHALMERKFVGTHMARCRKGRVERFL